MKCYFDEKKECPLSKQGIYNVKDYCAACQLYQLRKEFEDFIKGFTEGFFETLKLTLPEDLKGKLVAVIERVGMEDYSRFKKASDEFVNSVERRLKGEKKGGKGGTEASYVS